MSKVKKETSWLNKQGTRRTHTPAHPRSTADCPIIPAMMNCFLQGPIVMPLAPGAPYDPAEISDYITSVLQLFNTDDAYGLLAGIKENGGPVVPTLIFGIPPPNILSIALPPTPFGLPILVRQDWIMSANGLEARWKEVPVNDIDKITLAAVSVGVEGCQDAGGSFGGFLKRTLSPGLIFGITAAHCLPETGSRTPVCSPSTVEVTGRLNHLLPYTTLCPTTNRLHIKETKDIEAKSLLERFRFIDTPSGTSLLDPAAQFQHKQGILTGRHVGHVVASQFGSYQGLLHDYDQRLQALGYDIFTAHPAWKTRMDWSIFSCDLARYGGNIYDEDTIEQTGVLYPGAEVKKIGRTTGVRSGYVNGFSLQRWHSSGPTHEIAITGNPLGMSFAEAGDSGGCVFVKVGEKYQASGILIGINKMHELAIVTPLDLILASVPEYQWA